MGLNFLKNCLKTQWAALVAPGKVKPRLDTYMFEKALEESKKFFKAAVQKL